MAATTIGAGIFSLPYIFQASGWPLAIFFLFALSAAVHFSQFLYLKSLAAEGGRRRLLGMVGEYYGPVGRQFGLVVIVGGLVLTLVVYLVLAGSFLSLFAPGWILPGTFIFWLTASLIIIFQLRRLVVSEVLGSMFLLAVVAWIFLAGSGGLTADKFHLLPSSASAWILPFAPILFALAGWTAVEPIYEYAKKRGLSLRECGSAMAAGTFGSALAYALFVLGITGASVLVTPDTVSGLSGSGLLFLLPIAILGVLAIWTSYVPIGLEVRRSLEVDLRWPLGWSTAVVLFLPPLLLRLGLSDFLAVIGLVGGVFLGLEYVLILIAGRRALRLRGGERAWTSLLILVFVLAAVYEIYHFVIH